MNKQKKLELVSNALAAETKVLLAAHFSPEEVVFAQQILIETAQRIPMQLFMQAVLNLSKAVSFWDLFYHSMVLFWRLRQIQVEISALLADSLTRLKGDSVYPLNFQLSLSLNTTVLLLTNDEIICFFKQINCCSFLLDKSILTLEQRTSN